MDECTRFNYVPHKTIDNNFYEWESKYFVHLLNMFNIFERMAPTNKKVEWSDPNVFRKFCRMIYESSSGYIIDNLEQKNEILYKQYISNLKYE